MNKETEHLALSRPLRVDEIKDEASGSIETTAAEMTAIAKLLDLRGLEDLALTYRLVRAGAGRLRLKGELKATVIQTCVVSLEPVESNLEVPVEAEFWPEAMIGAHEEREEGHGTPALAEWPEPISEGRIDLGPLIYETLATSLEPYPKREGVSFEWSQEGEAPNREPRTSPFAALGALKRP
jgi:uncharacterized metal-binding protein YceD (DUF177 family)